MSSDGKQSPSIEEKREQFRNALRRKAQMGTSKNPDTPAGLESIREIEDLGRQFEMLRRLELPNPYFRANETITANTAVIGGRELISFSSYNYLGFAGDPRVIAAAQDATERFGTSSSTVRAAVGQKPLHTELENQIAETLGTDAAVVYVSGHETNVTVIGHLFGSNDLILHDALAHNSIMLGCKLSGARHLSFPHNDSQALEELLEKYRDQYERVLIVTEGIYSMDGDIADLPSLIDVKKRFNAFLMVDEAHSLGVLGATGRGIGEHFDVDRRDVDLWMGTLSKSLASCGGYIAGNERVVDYLRLTSPGTLHSARMTPANAAAALTALRLMLEEPQRIQQLSENSQLFFGLARSKGLDTGSSCGTPVVPVILGDSVKSLRLAHSLFTQGINVHPILHPVVPENATRLRFFITSEHSEAEIRQTIDALATTHDSLKNDELNVRIGVSATRH